MTHRLRIPELRAVLLSQLAPRCMHSLVPRQVFFPLWIQLREMESETKKISIGVNRVPIQQPGWAPKAVDEFLSLICFSNSLSLQSLALRLTFEDDINQVSTVMTLLFS